MRAVFYAGALALDNPRIDAEVLRLVRPLQWQLKQRVYHADDHAIAQAYLGLYFRQRDPAMIAPLRARFDYILAHPKTGSIDRARNPEGHSVWSWCDALYMAPPVWAGLAQATGNPAYLDFAVAGWWKTSDFLYDHEAHLFYRDSGSMANREANGAKVFWGRGNGWVVAGLVRVLAQLPAGHPARPRFEQQLREMAGALAALQQSDGLWRASLLDPASFPAPEVSSSGLICYALAWGVNQGVLDRATYAPVVLRAWQGLTSCVTPEGEVTNVQPIGAEPVKFDAKTTEDYGVGAFLLAASEVRQLGSGTVR
jgi:rhamnogalacturonyl hydrolase YesR